MGKKVLFVNQEIMPYVPETEMSVYGSEMPHVMQEAGYESSRWRVFPRHVYRFISLTMKTISRSGLP